MPLASATVTAAELLVLALLPSRMATTGCAVNATPLTAPAGCVVIASCVGGLGATVKFAEVTLSEGVVVVNSNVWVPVPVIFRLVNVATPFTAVAVAVPLSVPAPLAIVAVTTSVAPLPVVTTNPTLSSMRTTGCVINVTPLVAPFGCVCIDSDAATCVTMRDVDVALLRPLDVKVSV